MIEAIGGRYDHSEPEDRVVAADRVSARILLVEDDEVIATDASDNLNIEGHAVDWAADARRARSAFAETRYDLVVLDRTLPDGDGMALLGRWRAEGSTTPVILVTGRCGIDDRIQGLDAGADDYLVKPYAMPELLARVRAMLRRPGGVPGHQLTFGNIELDTVRRAVKIAGRRINMPRRELAVLELLMRNADKIVQRDTAMRAAYSADEHVSSNVLETNLSRLRQRLEEAGAAVQIHTVRGAGYMLQCAA